jgi:hypothetical protein
VLTQPSYTGYFCACSTLTGVECLLLNICTLWTFFITILCICIMIHSVHPSTGGVASGGYNCVLSLPNSLAVALPFRTHFVDSLTSCSESLQSTFLPPPLRNHEISLNFIITCSRLAALNQFSQPIKPALLSLSSKMVYINCFTVCHYLLNIRHSLNKLKVQRRFQFLRTVRRH